MVTGLTHEKCIHKKGGTRGSGNAAEPLRPMASELFGKKVRAVRFQSRSAAANGRAAAGSAANFLCYTLFFRNTISGAVILIILH